MSYDITDFQADVIKRSFEIPVLVDFWAEWCGPCKILGPVLEKLAEQQKDTWVLAKINNDVHQELAAEYGVRGIPNVKLFVDGKVVNEFTGALPEYAVTQWLQKALPDKFRKLLEQSQQLIAENKIADAQKVLEEILRQDSASHKARVLLAGTLVQSDAEKALQLVDGIEEDSEHHPIADAIRTFCGAAAKLARPEDLEDHPVKQNYLAGLTALTLRDFDTALSQFVEVIREHRYYDDDGARKACIAIFRILGDGHEVTLKWRREFGSALNR